MTNNNMGYSEGYLAGHIDAKELYEKKHEKILSQHSKMVEMLEKVGRHHQGGHSEIGFEIKELLKEVKA